jgi:regulator of replication initiation timing
MEKKDIFKQLPITLDDVKDEKIRETFLFLFRLIEELSSENRALKQENQRLRDELNRLKGEQGKPDIKPNRKLMRRDISSEQERKGATSPRRKRGTKKDKIIITRTEICSVDAVILPPDVIFKGYKSVVVQDLKIEPDNVEFQKEVYYSPSQKKTYMAELPAGYHGEFGPTIKALGLIMKNVCNMSEPKILEFFQSFKIQISAGSLSNLLIKQHGGLHQEKDEIIRAGLASSEYQQIDETSARVKGRNHHTHILCNPLYTAYITTEKKTRLSALSALQNGNDLSYCLNDEAFRLLEQFPVAHTHIRALQPFSSEQIYSAEAFQHVLMTHLPYLGERPTIRARILEAAAIASYHKGQDYPVVQVLVADDAPQFKGLTEELALCWVHDGRHYKKLRPVVPYYAQQLEAFLTQYWTYYHTLLAYQVAPSPETAQALSVEFDLLFSTHTDYQALNERISKTRDKKSYLLLVLKYPELPLHNNASELGARVQVRKRDVSLHTMTSEGTQANDTLLTLVETCKKLGVNAYEYIVDRVSKTFELPSLAEIILSKSRETKMVTSPP